jgi:hypothetical protein
MEKKSLVLILFVLFSSNLFCQTFFEGEIIYEIKMESKFPQILSNEILTSKFGNIEEYFIKNGNYKTIFNGKEIKMQMYLSNENKIYTQYTNSPDSLYWIFADKVNDSIKEILVIDDTTTTKIMGVNCKTIIMNMVSGSSFVYNYNEKYPVNIDLFKNHLYGNWYSYLELSHSLPLLIEVDNRFFKMTFTAKEIKNEKIKNNRVYTE